MHKKICCAAGAAMLAALMALGLLSSDVKATELPDTAQPEEAVEAAAKEVEAEDNVDETTLTIDVEDEELPENLVPEVSVADETLPQGPSTWERKSGVEGYVYRIYNVAMLREPEAGGAEYWENQLNTKAETASEVAKGFFFCEEFKSKNYSDAQFVRLLYRTIFGRDDTGDGLNYWLGLMENGMSREYVFKGFAESPEFTQLCQNYGVNRGNVTLEAYRDRNEGATGFIARLYTEMMARPYDEGGLEYWCQMYLTNSMCLDEIADIGFISSPEFENQNLSNEEFVKRTYKTFLNRTAEGDELNYWVKQLESGGMERWHIVEGFISSSEFADLKASYGLPPTNNVPRRMRPASQEDMMKISSYNLGKDFFR